MAKDVPQPNIQGTELATYIVKREIEKGNTLYLAPDKKFITAGGLIKSADELAEEDITSLYIRNLRDSFLKKS